MERKIGGIFEFKGSKYNDSVKLMVIESDTCEGCYFQLPVYGHCSTKQIYEETGLVPLKEQTVNMLYSLK